MTDAARFSGRLGARRKPGAVVALRGVAVSLSFVGALAASALALHLNAPSAGFVLLVGVGVWAADHLALQRRQAELERQEVEAALNQADQLRMQTRNRKHPKSRRAKKLLNLLEKSPRRILRTKSLRKLSLRASKSDLIN